MYQGTSERNTTLLTTAQFHHHSFAGRQLQEVTQNFESLSNSIVVHAINASKVEYCLFDS